MRLFRPDTPWFRLTTLDQRERLFARAGADAMLVFDFTRELAALDPRARPDSAAGPDVGEGPHLRFRLDAALEDEAVVEDAGFRSEARRWGKEGGRTVESRWAPTQ